MSRETRARARNRSKGFDSEDFQKDPFPVYKQLRDHHPIYDRFHNRWILDTGTLMALSDNESYDRAMYKADGPYDFGSRHVFGPNILYGNKVASTSS